MSVITSTPAKRRVKRIARANHAYAIERAIVAHAAWHAINDVDLSPKMERVRGEWEKENPGKDAMIDMPQWEFMRRVGLRWMGR